MSANLSLERIDYNRLMPRTCTVCSHRDREAIDQALVSGEPFRHIATRTGTSTAALQRHKHDHVPRSLAKAKEAQELAHADGLLDRVRWLCGRAEGFLAETEAIQREARAEGDKRLAVLAVHAGLKALRELRETVHLLSQLTGHLAPEPRFVIITAEQHEMMQESEQEVMRRIHADRPEPIDLTPEAEPSSAPPPR